MKDDLKRRTQIANNELDLFCYYNYALMFSKVFKNDKNLGIYLSTIFIRDLSVFLYETTKMYEYGYNKNIDEIIDNKFYSDLKYIRNRIKLYKKGKNKKEIEGILNTMQIEYKTKPKDVLYSLRSDISMFYHNNKRFIGNNFYSYYVFGKITNKMNDYKILKEFTYYISQSIKNLYNTIICEENKKRLGENFIKEKDHFDLSISLVDEKIDIIIKNSKFNNVITFEFFLIIQEISFIEILLIYIFDINSITSTLFLYFIVKQIAIKYDEIFDSISNIVNHMEEGKKLEKILLAKGILPLDSNTRSFAKNLRNNIHYLKYDWNINEGLINLENIFKNQANVSNWKQSYLTQFSNMLNILFKLSDTLKDYCGKA